MTLLLQYNVNNHILDGVHYIRWPIVFPGGEFVSMLSKDLLNFEPPIENAGYAPEIRVTILSILANILLHVKPSMYL